MDWAAMVQFSGDPEVVVFATTCTPALKGKPTAALSLVVKRPEREADYSPPSRSEDKNV